jgi:hypothetical protein
MGISEIENAENAVRRMTPEELSRFRDWFAQFDADAWDRQIEADAKSGRLDHLKEEARREFREGKCREL